MAWLGAGMSNTWRLLTPSSVSALAVGPGRRRPARRASSTSASPPASSRPSASGAPPGSAARPSSPSPPSSCFALFAGLWVLFGIRTRWLGVPAAALALATVLGHRDDLHPDAQRPPLALPLTPDPLPPLRPSPAARCSAGAARPARGSSPPSASPSSPPGLDGDRRLGRARHHARHRHRPRPPRPARASSSRRTPAQNYLLARDGLRRRPPPRAPGCRVIGLLLAVLLPLAPRPRPHPARPRPRPRVAHVARRAASCAGSSSRRRNTWLDSTTEGGKTRPRPHRRRHPWPSRSKSKRSAAEAAPRRASRHGCRSRRSAGGDSAKGLRILLITSRDTGRWVIPKGWPMRHRSEAEAAAREAYEEAGLRGDDLRAQPRRLHLPSRRLGPAAWQSPAWSGSTRSRRTRCCSSIPETGQRRAKWFSRGEGRAAGRRARPRRADPRLRPPTRPRRRARRSRCPDGAGRQRRAVALRFTSAKYGVDLGHDHRVLRARPAAPAPAPPARPRPPRPRRSASVP